MNRKLLFTPEARQTLENLQKNPTRAGLCRQLLKTLGLLETNLRHPSLNTHAFDSISGPDEENLFDRSAMTIYIVDEHVTESVAA